MPDTDFLPAWYPKFRLRKRMLALQGWLLLALVLVFGGWLVFSGRNIALASSTLNNLRSQLVQSQSEQKLLSEQLALRNELQTRTQLIASLGYPVEASRVFQKLDELLPQAASLTECTFETVSTPSKIDGVSVARAPGMTLQANSLPDRELQVRLVGIAPSEVDSTNFFALLANVPFFEQPRLVRTSQRMDAGHVLREFEVTFVINLNQPATE